MNLSAVSIENYLQRIQSVIGCKVKIEEDTEIISEIHIVSDLRRSPKQILRDIEAVMMSQFGAEIDYKKVSIAQIKTGTIQADQDPRLMLRELEYNNSGSTVNVKVVLEKQEQFYKEKISGINTTHNFKRLIGTAVLRAVESYLKSNNLFVFEDVKKVTLANVDVMVVSITSIHGSKEEVLTGSAKVTSDSNEAIARATLDAINRHVLHLDAIYV